jgi:hypothetical protein
MSELSIIPGYQMVEGQATICKMPDEEYFDRTELSHSQAKYLDQSPAHYWASLSEEIESTSAMSLGTLCHCVLLEPETVNDRFVPCDLDRKTNKYKEFAAIAKSEGKKVIKPQELYAAIQIVANIKKHKAAASLLHAATDVEAAVFFDRDGVKCRAKIDIVGDTFLADLKTCQDASPEGFGKNVAKYSYDTQAEWYLHGAEQAGAEKEYFHFIAVETVSPYAVAVYTVPMHVLESARLKNERRLAKIRPCIESGWYSGYSDGFQELRLPGWAFAKLNDEE